MAEPILTVEHLVKGYGENTVLDDVSFSVRPGEVVVVVGPSGCGKSTLLRCINALEPIQSGRVRLGNETVAYGGKGLTSLRQRIGMVREVLDVMLDLAKQGRTMIIVTHEMQFARAIADRVIFLDGGKIIEESTPEAFFDHPKTERAQKFLRTFTFDSVK